MKGTEQKPEQQSQDLLEELFRNVSSRERPSREAEKAVRESLHAQWVAMTRRRRWRRAAIMLATAASIAVVAVVAAGLFKSPDRAGPAIQLATVEKLIGGVDGGPGALNPGNLPNGGAILGPGLRIATPPDTRLALRWHSGVSIRVDENTRMLLRSADEIELISGRIYLDTGQAIPDAELNIVTPGGRVRHLGTRYLAATDGSDVSVSVRAGTVQLQAGGMEAVAGEGEQMNRDAAGVVRLETIPTWGPLWQWTETLAPGFASDGKTLSEFLDWVARESGRRIEYRSVQAENLALTTGLHGSVAIEPMRALEVMLQTTDLASEISAGTIVVYLRKP